MILCVDCRPGDTPQDASTDKINVEDTDDEFVIKKPDDANDPSYNQFISELYQHDQEKTSQQPPKAKRSADEETVPEKLTVESPKEFDIPVKPPVHQDENYDQFVTHLYRHDELKRSKRMIIFRHDALTSPLLSV